MKRHVEVVLGVLCICAVVPIVLAWASAPRLLADDCRYPNPNTKLCGEIPEDYAWCVTVTMRSECGGGKEYDIKNIPDGVRQGGDGYTMEWPAECIREAPCCWNPTIYPPQCEIGDYLEWEFAAEIFVQVDENYAPVVCQEE